MATELTGEDFKEIAIGDIGTQLFWLNGTMFEYGVPITAGAEFGGDTESFEAPETDLDYVPKVQGRTSINDVSYTVNYTAEKYSRIQKISDPTTTQTYMEVFSDGSAMVFKGTSGRPTITAGDVRQITFTIVPSYMQWVSNIFDLTEDDKKNLDTGIYTGSKINIDADTIPGYRPVDLSYVRKNTVSE